MPVHFFHRWHFQALQRLNPFATVWQSYILPTKKACVMLEQWMLQSSSHNGSSPGFVPLYLSTVMR